MSRLMYPCTRLSFKIWIGRLPQHSLLPRSLCNGGGGTFDGRQVPLHIRREKTKVLRQWLIDNENNSYPYKQEKEYLSWQSDMSVAQVNNWLKYNRKRLKELGLQAYIDAEEEEDKKIEDKNSTQS